MRSRTLRGCCTCRRTSLSCGRQASVDPTHDIRHDLLLADVAEEIVKVPFVKLQRLVLRVGRIMKVLAPSRLGRLVEGTVQDEHSTEKVWMLFRSVATLASEQEVQSLSLARR